MVLGILAARMAATTIGMTVAAIQVPAARESTAVDQVAAILPNRHAAAARVTTTRVTIVAVLVARATEATPVAIAVVMELRIVAPMAMIASASLVSQAAIRSKACLYHRTLAPSKSFPTT